MNSIPLKEIIFDLGLQNHYCYLVLAVIFTIIIRVILTIFKTLAIKNGEIDIENDLKPWKGKDYRKIFCNYFLSNGGDIRIDDYWLPAIIGLFELLIFPILMCKGLWSAIIAWIAIKTASSWGGWQKTRTSYNRFLFGNILSLFFSGIICLLCFGSPAANVRKFTLKNCAQSIRPNSPIGSVGDYVGVGKR